MDKLSDNDIIGQIINTTFGKASTNAGSTQSIKTTFINDEFLLVKYTTVVNFTGYTSLETVKRDNHDLGVKFINEYLKVLKNEFKDKTNRNLKLKTTDLENVWEDINFSTFAPRRTMYLKINAIVEFTPEDKTSKK